MFGVERVRALVRADGAGRIVADVVDAGFDDDCTLVALEISRA